MQRSSLPSSFWRYLICSQVSARLRARLLVYVCVTASICLCSATLTFIFFDLQCHNIWTPNTRLDPHPHPPNQPPLSTATANNLPWNTFRRVMSPDLQTYARVHLSCLAVMHTRHIHQTQCEIKEEEFPAHHYTFSIISYSTLFSLNGCLIRCLFSSFFFLELKHTSMCDRANNTRVGCVSEQNWTSPNWFTH